MSIYNGFATRQQETKYNSLIEYALIALKKRLLKFYKKENCDQDKFKLLVKKVYKQMVSMEKSKFLAPKYSVFMLDLVEYLEVSIDFDSMSEMSSVFEDSISFDGGRNQFLKSKSVLQEKKNTIKRVLGAEREREQSEDYFKNLTHLNADVADEIITSEETRPKPYILDSRSLELLRDPPLKPLKLIPPFKITKPHPKQPLIKPQPTQPQQTLPINQHPVKYFKSSPPQLQDFIPVKGQVIEKAESHLKQSQSKVLINPITKSREHNRSFRKQRFQKIELKNG